VTGMIAAALDQDEVWVNAEGVHRLEEMDPDHRSNLIPFLRRSAVALAAWCDLELSPAEAQDWLAAKPLMQRLTELEAGRSIDDRLGTHERNVAHEVATGYVKQRIPTPAEALARLVDPDGILGGEW
jgi:hypothetical protein